MKRLILIFLLLTAPAWGWTYYVSNSGNDSRNTTQAQSPSTPWLTLGHSCGQLAAGDTLYIMGGTWTEANASGVACQSSSCNGNIMQPPSGSSGNPIVFKAYGTRPLLTSSPYYANYGIEIENRSHLVFDSLIIRGTMRGISIFDDSHYITIKNCVVDSTGGVVNNENNAGVMTLGLGQWKDSIIVEACTLSNNWEHMGVDHDGGGYSVNCAGVEFYWVKSGVVSNNVIFGGSSYSHAGIFLKVNSDSINVFNNRIYNQAGHGISIYHANSNVNVYGNIIYNCADGIAVQGAMAIYTGKPNLRSRIYNNTVYNCGGSGLTIQANGDECAAFPDSTQFWNNIISNCGTGMRRVYIDPSGGCSSPVLSTADSSTYNCYYGYTNMANWDGTNYTLTSFHAHGITEAGVTHYLEGNSVNTNPVFLSTTPSNAYFLRLDTLNSPSSVLHSGRGGAWPTYMGAYDPYGNWTPEIDSIPPEILDGPNSDPNQTGAAISIISDEPATVRIPYGLTTAYGDTASSVVASTGINVNISGLSANTTYHFKVIICDVSNNCYTSGDFTFVTDAVSGGVARNYLPIKRQP